MKKIIALFLLAFSLNAFGQSAVLYCDHDGGWGGSPSYFINGVIQDSMMSISGEKKIQIAIIDSCSFIPWEIDSCLYYFNQVPYCTCTEPCNVLNWGLKNFQFYCNNSTQMNGLVALLNSVPQGNHILAYSLSNYASLNCNWPSSVRNAFSLLGSNLISTIADSLPFIFYIQKGFPSTMNEVAGASAHDTIDLTVTMECLPASVNEHFTEMLSFTIFPNPAFDELIIDIGELKIKEVEIYNTLGEKVYSQQQTTNDKQQTVDVSQLLPGVYFVAVTDDKGNKITKRFIKM